MSSSHRDMMDNLTTLADESLCNSSTADLMINYENVVCA